MANNISGMKISFSAKINIESNKHVVRQDLENQLDWAPVPNETLTSHDVGMIDVALSKIRQNENVIIGCSRNAVNSPNESVQDIFHESDYDDTDYIPSEKSESVLNSTSESIMGGNSTLKPNVASKDSPEVSRVELFLPSSTSRKKRNKTNKNLGLEYVTYKNQTKPAREMQKLEKCRQECQTKINNEHQKKIFESYWGLGDYDKRRQILLNLIEVKTKKSEVLQKSKNPRYRQYTYFYHFEINGIKTRVCKQCFLKIFGETEQSVKTICHYKTLEFGSSALSDRRGKHAPMHKLSLERHNEVLQFIDKIPKYESHYSRRHTSQIYFARGLNLSTLYTMYKNKSTEPVSETKFQKIFHTLKIKFKKPQLDLCTHCETLKSKIKNSEDSVAKSDLLLQLTNHHNEADFAYKSKKYDKEHAVRDPSVKMFTFDLQQCLPTPFLNASIFFYKRPLWTFNLTIHDGATNKAYCYIWYESIAKRGANDIGSCIYKCLLDLPNSVKHIILYSDSCPGQNRNSYVSAMLSKVLQDHPSIETIDHKFLVVGHTHLECDTVHAQIEKKKKNSSGSIQHPHDWANLIATTNKKYVVHELKQDDFYDFQALLKNNYTWRTTNTAGEMFEWKNIRWMRYVRGKPGILQYKLSHIMDETFKELNINQRRRINQSSSLSKCYNADIPISANKKRDLIEMLPLINSSFHNFNTNLKTEGECEVELDSDLDEIEIVE